MMRNRCDNPNNSGYKWYGGQGIGYDPRWNDFVVFVADITTKIGDRPPRHTLDRIDNTKGYFIENVRWATDKVQNNNRRPAQEWNHMRRRIEHFTAAELLTELKRRIKLGQVPSLT
jgi:hypothetical protein